MTQYLSPEEQKALGVTGAEGLPAPPEATEGPPPPAPVEGPCHLAGQRLIEDTLVTRGPLLFWGAILTSDGVGTADVTLYEGRNASGRRLFKLLAPTTQSMFVILPRPILLEDGLYVDVGSNVGDFFPLYSPLWE